MIKNSPELEQMAGILSLSADLMRKIATGEIGDDRNSLSKLADHLDDVAVKLVDLIYPPTEFEQ